MSVLVILSSVSYFVQPTQNCYWSPNQNIPVGDSIKVCINE